MNFLNSLKNHFYNPRFYAGLKEQRLGLSFRYFFSIIVPLSVMLAFVFGVEIAPTFSAENLRKLVGFYPPELIVQIKNGVISSNVTEPYGIKESPNYSTQDSYTNIAVIDTKSDFSANLFKNYDTRVLIGKNFLVVSKSRQQFEFTDLSRMPDFSLSQGKIFHWIDLVSSFHWLISLALFVALFLGFFGFFSVKLIGLLILALIILFLARIKKVQLSYRNSYQISLHALTIPLILETFFILANLGVPFTFFFSAMVLVIAFINIKHQSLV